MMRRIIENFTGHPLTNQKVIPRDELPCSACSLGKLIVRPSPVKLQTESPSFLERIQGDICGPIHPSSGPFRYFMVLIDASTRWSHVYLHSTRNVAFAKLLAQIIKLFLRQIKLGQRLVLITCYKSKVIYSNKTSKEIGSIKEDKEQHQYIVSMYLLQKLTPSIYRPRLPPL